MWRNAFSAGWIRRINSAVLGFSLTLPWKSGAGSGSALPTRPRPVPSTPPPLGLEDTLHRRAMRIRNREPRAIAQYMQTQMNLHRGR